MLGMSAREYVVQGCELAAGALRGQGSLGIRVHTAHGEVDLTCTDAQQWCLYAAGLNGEGRGGGLTRDVGMGLVNSALMERAMSDPAAVD